MSRSLHIILSIFLLTTHPTHSEVDWDANGLNNPSNKFCGLSYSEAQKFCHLPPKQSLPCPNGEEECPYEMPCWEIEEECTEQPTLAPTERPSRSPITKKSEDASDHYFCGLGFDQLYDCAVHCPGGSVEECPSGQICYFDTPCDARIIKTAEPSPAPVDPPEPEPSGKDAVATEEDATTILEDEKGNSAGSDEAISTEEENDGNSTDSEETTLVEEEEDSDLSGKRNFCGETYMDASTNCTRDKHCPSGLSIDCPKGLECFSFLPNCNVDDMPTPYPTISMHPTTEAPTTSSPTITPPPTGAPIGKDDMRYFFFCGLDWGDASKRCYMQCVSGFHSDCPEGEQCFAQADCPKGVIKAPPTTPAPIEGTLSPTVTQEPSISPTETFIPSIYTTDSPEILPTLTPTTAFPTGRPTFGTCEGDPCPKDDQCRSVMDFCGEGEHYCNDKSTWEKACEDRTDPPTTASPSDSPTTSPPSESPTTASPTVSMAPSINTTILVTLENTDENVTEFADINTTSVPTITPAPVSSSLNESTLLNTTAPTTSTPTESPTEYMDVDKECNINPDGPLCSFFCGVDWNTAITECPQRCPSGDSKDCPEGWSCYAFTPCIAVGINTPPTLKPTWEPTMRPITGSPTTTIHHWNEQNKHNTLAPAVGGNEPEQEAVWTAAPTFKPTYSPTMDQCRAPPCENPGECRSGLGFCGTGIVYCNTMSSWRPECIGGVSQLQSIPKPTPPPTLTNKGGPPTITPTTKWDAWIQANYASDTTAPTISFDGNMTGDVVDSNTTIVPELNGTSDEKDTSTPTTKPVADPFGWVSSGTFDGEGYTYSDSDSPWWSQGRASSAPGMRTYGMLTSILVLIQTLLSN